MKMRKYIGSALMILGLAAMQGAAAEGKTFLGANYAITFQATGWDTVKSGNIIAKLGGLYGMATMGATPGSNLPNLDSLTTAFSDSLGGEIKKDSSGLITLGKYDVHWQKYTYDTLPKLSKLISSTAPFPVTLSHGSFRVYYLVADGFQFTIACMSILPGGIAPYPDVEAAIKTLRLGVLAGIRDRARTVSRDLWIREGQLGGAWLDANKPTAIEAFDTRGFRLGSGVPTAKGTWSLPVSRQEMFLRVRAADGSSLQFVVHP